MELKLPGLSEGTESAVITFWHAVENDQIECGQDLLEVATDKATFDVPAPCGGVLVKIIKKNGEEVRTDEIIAEIKDLSPLTGFEINSPPSLCFAIEKQQGAH